MATQTSVTVRPSATQQADYGLLRRMLLADTVISAVSGLTMTLFARPIEEFVGGDQPEVLMLIGIGLILFAVFNFTTARETPLSRTKAWIIFEINVLWVIASIVILAANVFDMNTTGNVITLVMAVGVAGIAFIEWLGLRQGAARQ